MAQGSAAATKAERQEQDRRPRTLRLYDAIEALDILDELIEEHSAIIEAHGGDIECIPAIAELLAFAEGDFERTVERYGLKIRTLLAEAEGAKVELDRLQGVVNRKVNAAKRLKEFLKRNLESRDVRKVVTSLVTVRIQANGQPSVSAASEGLIEELYASGSEFIRRKETFDLDRDKILDAQAIGVELPDGILIVKGSHLRVE
jgi:dTDP-4-amino-4,6-dideoxygalactose transaminase